MTVLRALLLILVTLAPAFASEQPQQPPAAQQEFPPSPARDASEEVAQLRSALVRLPLAAVLASILAVRPRRRGTPHRKPAVIETQIILAVVGAVVMLVVGSSLARAFGIVGAAGLVRYRAKIDDPKDAGVMLSTLAVGLAAGVGLWMIAIFSTAFILVMLFVIESIEPAALTVFALTVKAKDPTTLKPKLEELLKRNRLEFALRTSTPEEVCYEVKLPLDRKTDRLSNVILKLDPENATGVEWDEKKPKK